MNTVVCSSAVARWLNVFHRGGPRLRRWSALAASLAAGVAFTLPVVGALTNSATAQPAAGAPQDDKPKFITTVEGVSEYDLPNGLRVLLLPDPSIATVTVHITYFVGSRFEGTGESGMAHLLEHMQFKGTPSHPEIWGELNDHGAQFNATTSTDRTNFFETLQSTDENLDFALSLEADRMLHSNISAKDLASEMTVVRNEFEMNENSPQNVMYRRLLAAAYLWHNYGKATIGNRSDIERVPASNLKVFYQKYYRPDNAMLQVAGKFDTAKTLTMIQKYFGPLQNPPGKLPDTWTEEPVQDGPRSFVLERVGELPVVGLHYHTPSASDPEAPAVEILADVLSDQPAGRLYKALVQTGKTTDVNASVQQWDERSPFIIMATVAKNEDPDDAMSTMISVTEHLDKQPVTEDEVDRARTGELKYIKMAIASSSRLASQLSEWAASGDWRMFFIYRDRLKSVTAADVNAVAAKYLIESNRTSGKFIPTQHPVRAQVPDKPDIASLVANYKGTEEVAAGESFKPTVDNIEANVERFTLDNGMKAALLQKKTRGEEVNVSIAFQFGSEQLLNGHQTALGLIPEMIMRGSDHLTYQQIQDQIDRLQSTIRMSGTTPGEVVVTIHSDHNNIAKAINLAGELLRSPTFPEDQFDIVIKERLAQLQKNLSEPQPLAFTALARALSPYPPASIHYVPTIQEQIDRLNAVKLSEIRQLYQTYYGVDHSQVAVVGDYNRDDVISALEGSFRGWNSKAPYQRIDIPYVAINPDSQTILTPDKQMSVVMRATVIPVRDDDKDYPALNFANYILGRSSKSRLLTELRQKAGLSYGAGSMLRADDEDPRTMLTAYAICANQNAAKAMDLMRNEMNKWVNSGLSPDEMTDGKQSFQLMFENSLSRDPAVTSMLQRDLYLGRTLKFDKEQMEAVQHLTLDQIQETLKRHFKDAAFVEIKAGDLAKYVNGDNSGATGQNPAAPAADDSQPTSSSGH